MEVVMKSHTIAPGGCAHTRCGSGWTKRLLPLALIALTSRTCLLAQEAAPTADADKQTIQMLLQRIEKLEARVSQLEGTQETSAKVQAVSTTSQESPHPLKGP